jgi:transcriptional regulator with XRE-family HTH domain
LFLEEDVMDVVLNDSNAMASSAAMNGELAKVPIHPAKTNVPPREVIRCLRCQLVQFRTASGRCRRCVKALPPRLLLVRRAANSEESSPTVAGQLPAGSRRPFLVRNARLEKLTIGAKLVRCRKERGLSQTELARQAGIPRSYVSRMENNHLTPGPRIAARLAATLGITIVDLLSRAPESASEGLLAKDPVCAQLLLEFPRLEPREMATVLAEAQIMLADAEVASAPTSPAKARVAAG